MLPSFRSLLVSSLMVLAAPALASLPNAKSAAAPNPQDQAAHVDQAQAPADRPKSEVAFVVDTTS